MNQRTEKENHDHLGTTAVSNIHVKGHHPMDVLLKNGAPLAFAKVGDIVEGTVLEKKGGRLFLDLGIAGMGIVYGAEYYAADELIKALNIGDTISAKVVELDNDEGYRELSLQEAGRERRWIDLKKMKDEGIVLDLSVLKANTGGLILQTAGVEGFLPTSQLSAKNYPRVEGGDKEKIFQELQKLVSKILKVRVLDIDPQENKLIFTEKGLFQEAARNARERCHLGDIVDGVITGVVDFGAFIKFLPSKQYAVAAQDADQNSQKKADDQNEQEASGRAESSGQSDGPAPDEIQLEGLIHLSEIDWSLVANPREVLKVGDRVRAKIIEMHGDKISLSLKRLKQDPWQTIAEKYRQGDEVSGTVTRLNPFGAFVEIEKDIQGLAHISEFASEQYMKDTLKVGQQYSFTILSADPKDHRISLGILARKDKSEQETANTPTDARDHAEEDIS